MLVVVKKPRTRIRLTGEGSNVVYELLKSSFKEVRVFKKLDDDEELIDFSKTELYKQSKKRLTPGKCLWIYRDNLGLTQEELSERTGISKSNISAMENNKRRLGVAVAKKLAKALGIDYKQIL